MSKVFYSNKIIGLDYFKKFPNAINSIPSGMAIKFGLETDGFELDAK
jgi:hypothetical protein